MWIDTHAHLFEYTKDSIEKLLNEAAASSVEIILSTATDLQNSIIVSEQCKYSERIYGAAGISPFDVINQPDDYLDQLRNLLKRPRMIATGEIGLDCTNPVYPPLEKQIPYFESQLILARELDLPAIIHSRGCEKQAIQTCRNLGINKVVLHCFTGSYLDMKAAVDAGYYISFSGILTFKNASIREIAPHIPIDQLLIETDSPYLSPIPLRGLKNHPAYLKYTGEELARLLSITTEMLQEQLKKNFYSFFFKS